MPSTKRSCLIRNVADSIDLPRSQRVDIQTWDENDIRTFLEAARPTEYYAVFYLALYTGTRRSELLALRWGDIDLILGQISINRGMHHLRDGSYSFSQPKSEKWRSCALITSIISFLLKCKNPWYG